jgi:small GTP-binding protein
MPEPENPKKTSKIVIMGLDNSGKTSILLSLQKNTNLLSYFALKPTQGLNVIKVEDEIAQFSIWELGGQKKYRNDYLQDLPKYTNAADRIIFVIDVQDIARYELALTYLANIFTQIEKESFELCIFLHKFDPGLEAIEKFSTEQLSNTLLKRINSIIPADYNFKIFKTTIFTVFQKTLLQ